MYARPLNPRRNKAFLIDSLIYLAVIVLPLLVAEALPAWLGGRAVVLGGVLGLFYIVFRDGFNGQSIGKRIFNIQIVKKETGKPIASAWLFSEVF